MTTELELVIGVLLIIGLAAVAVRWRAIDIAGSIAGAIISILAFLAGGFSWLLMIIIFFGVSSAMTKFKYDYKRKLGFAQDKFGTRSWPNSIANGGVAAIAAVGELFSHSEILAVMFLSSVAVALSDTLATEIGLLNRSKPRLITNPTRSVEPGTSGGVSLLGEGTAALSAVGLSLVGVAASVIDGNNFLAFISIVIGALIGVFFDSILGATIQGINKCIVCDKMTESFTHHGQRTKTVRGLRFFDNNVVNFSSILLGALCSIGIYLLISGS